MRWFLILTVILGWGISANPAMAAAPEETVRLSEQVLGELMAIPGKQIPQRLLEQAQGVAIIPNVIKIGFVAGARRGHGVVMVRDAEGEWSLPQFITLTGGSVGWQAGIQGTDVVLVFTTKKGVEGLMRGKFTIGADAAATAGPVGRNAEVATDGGLKAEIYSYSRSRGLFLGVSIDGSALDVDHYAHAAYYGSPSEEIPGQIPESSARLRQYLVELPNGSARAAGPNIPAGPNPNVPGNDIGGPTLAPPPPPPSTTRLDALRRGLNQNAAQLQAILSPEWRRYLAMPKEVLDPAGHPSVESLAAVEQRFSKIVGNPQYQQLSDRPEFQGTYEMLREYLDALSANQPELELPPPPPK
ncbi:MAG: lipid-binding SYLF domain-containing protein [Planctomycetota bacterium]